jgi:hypothetical protein
MQNLGYIVKRTIIIMSIILLIPTYGYSATPMMNFLPMEDALASARNVPELTNSRIKPYRESFSLGDQKINNNRLFSFSNTDIFAFILLAGAYIMLVRRNSKPRNISF